MASQPPVRQVARKSGESTITMQTKILIAVMMSFGAAGVIHAQSEASCAKLAELRLDGVEITKAAWTPAGTTLPPAYPGAPALGPLPAHCRVDGVINRRKGAGGEEFGIRFAVALPEKEAWNGDFMMQGGGGGNGFVGYPVGASYTGGKPALVRGFAVASTDTGHKSNSGALISHSCATSRLISISRSSPT